MIVAGDQVRVLVEQFQHPVAIFMPYDGPDVVFFLDGPDGFGRIEGRHIGVFLPSQTDDDPGVVFVRFGGSVGFTAQLCVFQFGPLGPQIDAATGFDHFGNVRPPYPTAGFQEIKFAVVVRADPFGVARAVLHAEGFHHLGGVFAEGFIVVAAEFADHRLKNTAAVGHLEGGVEVLTDAAKDHLPVETQRIDVIDVSRFELLYQTGVPLVAEFVDDLPELFFGVNFFDPGSTCLEAGFDDPGSRDGIGKVVDLIVVEQGTEGRAADAPVAGLDTHGQFIAEVAGGGLPHAVDAERLAQEGGFFHVEIVEGDDAVYFSFAHQPGRSENHVVVRFGGVFR